ncbi:MAG: thiamine-phosphate kinase [Candidatus Melainabacteria bacterium RIFOXYA12_FULL_32_12]|nr:MAG: thiamine-phosphate kinase [Candidatus Melainabacteria bacterium RIFOXYA12_FULL_32_12]
MKEDKFINLIKSLLPESSAYIGDDTAYIAEKDLILTQDTLIEDVHFRKSTISPYDLGMKAIAVNLSDIAAAGGIPAYILISLSLPQDINEDFVEEFYRGVKYISQKYGVLIVGGDLTRADKITISIAMMGFGNGITPTKRSYAKVGDFVITTGESGSSATGLWLLETQLNSPNLIKDIPKDISDKFIKTHINPIPRLAEGRTIVSSCKTPPALMDTSDGLADALYKICLQSNVSMEINFEDIPVDKDLYTIAQIAEINPLKWIFYGGEDYQLVGTVSKECLEKLAEQQMSIRVIGRVIESNNNPSAYVKVNNDIITINSSSLNTEAFKHFI